MQPARFVQNEKKWRSNEHESRVDTYIHTVLDFKLTKDKIKCKKEHKSTEREWEMKTEMRSV